jgi:hypothetical protein
MSYQPTKRSEKHFTCVNGKIVQKKRPSGCGKKEASCVIVLDTKERPQYGPTTCAYCFKQHKPRMLFQINNGFNHCCSTDCLKKVKKYFGYESREDSFEPEKPPLYMLCPDCGRVKIDTKKVKVCDKCIEKYPKKCWGANGY